MQRYIDTYGWLLTVWLLWACSQPAAARISAQSSDSWGYTPAYSTTTTSVTPQAPACTFRSTSTYSSGLSGSAYAPTVSAPFEASAPNRARQWSPWDEDGDPSADPVGVVPVGEPLCLLLMALLYVAIRLRRRIAAGFRLLDR